MNEFFYDKAGNLNHKIDGELRAIVPPVGLDDYRKSWPEAPLPAVPEVAVHENQ